MGEQKVKGPAIITDQKTHEPEKVREFLIGLILNLAFSSPRTDYRVSL